MPAVYNKPARQVTRPPACKIGKVLWVRGNDGDVRNYFILEQSPTHFFGVPILEDYTSAEYSSLDVATTDILSEIDDDEAALTAACDLQRLHRACPETYELAGFLAQLILSTVERKCADEDSDNYVERMARSITPKYVNEIRSAADNLQRSILDVVFGAHPTK